MITTLQNKQMKEIVKLKKNARYRRKELLFLVEGIRMYEEVPEDMLVSTYVTENFYESHPEVFGEQAVELVSEAVMKEISDTETPQGVLALVKMCSWNMEDMLKEDKPLVLVLENVQDPGNLGTILRTSEGAGVSGIIMSKDTVDIYNPKVIRSTMGSIFRIPFIYVEDIREVVSCLGKHGVTTYAACLGGATYTKEDYSKGTAFFIGNEGNGLSRELQEMADQKIVIPMSGKLESLNAAMAAGLLVYEARRQREKGG